MVDSAIVDFLRENPLTTSDWATKILIVLGFIGAVLQSYPNMLPEISNLIGLNAQQLGIITMVFVFVNVYFSAKRIAFRGNEMDKKDKKISNLEEKVSTLQTPTVTDVGLDLKNYTGAESGIVSNEKQ